MPADAPGPPVAVGPQAALAGSTAALVLAQAADAAGTAAGAGGAQARALQQRLARLADEDAAAFTAARGALAQATEGGDERRDFALGNLLERSAEVPLLIAEACADVVGLAAALEAAVLPETQPDVRAAAMLAAGAAHAAALLVETNLGVAPGDARVVRAQAAVAAADAAW